MSTPGTRSASAPANFLSPGVTWMGYRASSSLGEGLRDVLRTEPGRVIVAADRAIARADMLDETVDALNAAGYEPIVLTDFGPELLAEQVDAAAEQARDAPVSAVVGVGGGSVLDAAKMIALLATNEGASKDWLGVVEPPRRRLPLVLVPTTIGTGAEVTRISMITFGGEKRVASSRSFVPDLVVLDDYFVASLPASVKGSTGMDALAHATEAVMSSISSPMTDLHAFEAIRIIVADLPAAYDGDVEATGRVLRAAYLAGLALNAGVVLGHSLAYAITHEKPLPHGTTCAVALPYCIAYNQNLDRRRATALALALTRGESDRLEVAAQRVKQLARRVGQPTDLDEAGIPAGREDSMASRCVDLYPRLTNPEPMDLERVRALLDAMRGGDLQQAFAVTGTRSQEESR
jgi:alcohol dehydrogenase class IV